MNRENIRKSSVKALDKIILMFGTQKKLADALGILPAYVSAWKVRDKYGVPARFVIPLEKISEGKVSRFDLRPDIYPSQ